MRETKRKDYQKWNLCLVFVWVDIESKTRKKNSLILFDGKTSAAAVAYFYKYPNTKIFFLNKQQQQTNKSFFINDKLMTWLIRFIYAFLRLMFWLILSVLPFYAFVLPCFAFVLLCLLEFFFIFELNEFN